MSEAFLSRWSRLKKTGGEAEPVSPPIVPPLETEIPVVPAAQNAPVLEEISQNLPPIESLTPESDFTAFMQPKVSDALKRQALKKLFTDPHFNTMDGLDVYVDDYSVSVPIPEDWYKDIPSWQAMLNPKPPMVVTDGGYAVEADSEEGIATLAARNPESLLASEKQGDERVKTSLPSDAPSRLAPLPEGEADKVMLPPPGGEGRGEGDGVTKALSPSATSTHQLNVVRPSEAPSRLAPLPEGEGDNVLLPLLDKDGERAKRASSHTTTTVSKKVNQ